MSARDDSTRAAENRRHFGVGKFARVTAALILVAAVTALAPALARSAQAPAMELSSATVNSLPTAEDYGPSHDIAIEIVGPGREGLQLTARLSDTGDLIERGIEWTISTLEGVQIFSNEAPEADILVAPGDYLVELRYGAVNLASTVTLLAENRLIVSFVLNAGGIRVLPRVKGMGLPQNRAVNRIYALSGPRKGHVIASSDVPGEIIRVPAGDYRVVSTYAAGNVRAVADVTVKPGLMSAIEIDHAAGLARLSFVGAPDSKVLWHVIAESGEELAALDGLSADLVLKPGAYIARAEVNGETLTAKFSIAAGEARDIIFGN